jgi:hypothetical protein
MKTATIIAVMLVGFLAAGQCHGQPTDSLPEKYVKKVLIEAKWGDGPGEFGYYKNPPQDQGPHSFDVDIDGFIYIADYYNGKIKIYDNNGILYNTIPVTSSIVRADNRGNMFVYETTNKHLMNIKHYSRKGELLQQVANIENTYIKPDGMPKRSELAYWWSVDEDGDLWEGNEEERIYRSKNTKLVKNQRNIKTEKTKIQCRLIKSSYQVMREKWNQIVVTVQSNGNTTVIKPKGLSSLLGIDRKGNVYIKSITDHTSVLKYNVHGVLKAKVVIVVPLEEKERLGPIIFEPLKIDMAGCIYYIRTTPQKASIYKWEICK